MMTFENTPLGIAVRSTDRFEIDFVGRFHGQCDRSFLMLLRDTAQQALDVSEIEIENE